SHATATPDLYTLSLHDALPICGTAGALLGMLLRSRLPEHHLSADSRDVVKLAMGVVATMTALVLGMLVASAKTSFDAQRQGVAQDRKSTRLNSSHDQISYAVFC